MANQITALLKLLGDASGAVKAINDVDKSLSGLQKAGAKLSSIGKSMTTYVTAPLVGVATVAGKVAVDFDKAMMGVNSVLKLSGQEFQTLKQDVLAFSTTTSQSSSDVAASLRGIVSSGFEAADAMTILRTTVDAAGNMMTDTATTTRAMTSVLQAFGMEATEVTHVADVMETAANASALQFEELTSSIGNAVGTAAAAGVSFEDTAAAMMTISDAGYSAAEASTALRSLMTEMLKPSDELAEAIQSWGYETGEAALQAEGLEGIIQLLMQTTGGSAAEMAELLGNIRAQKAAFALARDEGSAFADSMREIGEASAGAGEHAKMAEIRHQSWAYQLAKLKSELEVLTIRLAEGFMPAVIDVVVAAKDFATTLAELPQPVLNTAVKVAALVAALGPLLMITGQVIMAVGALTSVIGPIIGSIGGLGTAALSGQAALAAMGGGAAAASGGIAAFGASLAALLGPIALVAAAIGGLYLLVKKAPWPDTIQATREYEDTLHDASSALNEMNGFVDESANTAHQAAVAQQRLEEDTRRTAAASELGAGQMSDYAEMELHAAEAADRAATARGRAADAARLQAQADAELVGATESVVASQEALESQLDHIKLLIDGPVRKANEEYIKQEKEILGAISDLEAELAEYERRQGVVVGSTDDLIVAQADLQKKTEKLTVAQQALAENTDPDKQLELEAAVVKAKQAVEGANQAVSAAGPHHANYRSQIDETKGKLDEWMGKLKEAAEAHKRHIQEIILSMLEARLAAEDWSQEAIDLYAGYAEATGMMDEETAKAWRSVGEVVNDTHAGIEEKLRALLGITDEFVRDALGPEAEALLYTGDQAVKLKGDLAGAEAATRLLDDEAGILADTVVDLGGKAVGTAGDIGLTEGALREAEGAARDFKAAMDAIPSHKTITITVNAPGKGDLAKEFQTESPRFVFQTALENLVAFARNNPIDIDINLPTEKLEKFAGAIDTLGNAITSLSDLGEALADLGGALEGLGEAAVYGEPTGAFGQITFVLERLAEWARMIQGVLVDIVDRMPALEEKTQEAIESTADLVGMMDDLMSNLYGLHEVLGDVGELLETLPLAAVYGVPTEAFQDIVFVLERMAEWAQMLQGVLVDIATQMPALSDSMQDVVEETTDALGVLTDMLGALADFGAGVASFFDTMLEVVQGWYLTATPAWYSVLITDLFVRLEWIIDALERNRDLIPQLSDELRETAAALTGTSGALTDVLNALEDFGAGIASFLNTMLEVVQGWYLTATPVWYSVLITNLFVRLEWIIDALERNQHLIPQLSDELQAALVAVNNSIGVLTSFIDALTGFGDTLATLSAEPVTMLTESQIEDALQALVDRVNEIADELVEFSDELPTLSEEAFAAITAVTGAMGVLEGLMSALLSFGDTLAKVTTEPVTALTEYYVERALQALVDWVNDLTDDLVGFADTLPDLSEETETAIQAVTDSVGVLGVLVSALTSFGDAVAKVSDEGIAQLEAADVEDALDALSAWVLDLEQALRDIADDLPQLSEAASETFIGATDAVGAFSSLIGALTGFGDTLSDIEDSAASASSIGDLAQPLLEYLSGLVVALEQALRDIADELPQLSEEAHTALQGATDATSALSGLIGALTGFGDALGNVEDSVIAAADVGEYAKVLLGYLKRLVVALEVELVEMAGELPQFSEETLAVLQGVTDSTSALSSLIGALTGFGDALGGVTDSVTASTGAGESAQAMLEYLSGLVAALEETLTEIAGELPNLSEDVLTVLKETTDSTSALSSLVSALTGFGDALSKVSDDGIAQLEVDDVIDALQSMVDWIEDLDFHLLIWAISLPELNETMAAVVKAATDTTNALAGMINALLGFAGALAKVGDIEADMGAALDRFVGMSDVLLAALEEAWGILEDLVETDGILDDWTEGASVMTDKMKVLASTLQAAFGPLNDAVGFLSTLAEHSLEGLLGAFGKFEVILPKLEDMARSTYEMLRDFAEQELTDWEEGASDLADKTDRMSETIRNAFGALDTAIGAMSSLISLMWDMATLAGTEHLEVEDFVALGVGINLFMTMLAYALDRLKSATAGLDLSELEGIGESLKGVGEGLIAMADGMQAMINLVAPTVDGTESVVSGINNAKVALEGAMVMVSDTLTDPPWADATWFDYGYTLLESLVNGINAALPDLEAVLQYIRDLMPSSPAKRGPLSERINWGFLSEGIPDALDAINAALTTPQFGISMPDLQGAFAGAAGGSNFSWTINNPTREPEDIARDIRRAELVNRYKT